MKPSLDDWTYACDKVVCSFLDSAAASRNKAQGYPATYLIWDAEEQGLAGSFPSRSSSVEARYSCQNDVRSPIRSVVRSICTLGTFDAKFETQPSGRSASPSAEDAVDSDRIFAAVLQEGRGCICTQCSRQKNHHQSD